MNSTLPMIEAHLNYVCTKHLEDALRKEQLRLAQGNRLGPIRQTISRIRLATGLALIAIGTRLQPGQTESIPTTEARTA